MSSKKVCQRIHAKRRLEERFGFTVNRHEFRELVQQITSGKAEHLESQSNRVSIKAVTFKGKKIAVAYDKSRQTIITFLPDEALQEYKNEH
jgi:hypothetical protein